MLEAWESGDAVTYPDLPGLDRPALVVPAGARLARARGPRAARDRRRAVAADHRDRCSTTSRRCRPSAGRSPTARRCCNDPKHELERICEFVGLEADERGHPADCAPCATRSRRATGSTQSADERARGAAPAHRDLAERARELLAKPAQPDAHRGLVGPRRLPASQRLHPELPPDARAARQLAAGLHLPDREADLRPPRPRRRQHPLPRLPAADGPGGRAGPDRDRHPGRGPRLPRTSPRSRRRSSRRAATTPASCPATSTSPATSASTRSPSPRASCGSPRPTSPASRRSTPSTASSRAGSRRSSASSTAEDRCHLNGLCVIDDQVRYVTALGETDEPGGWRENKASGGILIDVESGETVLDGPLDAPLAALARRPHVGARVGQGDALGRRPRRRAPSRRSPSCPGSPAGSLFAGGVAFVGLSQVRETATFGGLPLMERLDERLCGVWAVDPQSRQHRSASSASRSWCRRSSTSPCCPACATPRSPRRARDAASQSFVLPCRRELHHRRRRALSVRQARRCWRSTPRASGASGTSASCSR